MGALLVKIHGNLIVGSAITYYGACSRPSTNNVSICQYAKYGSGSSGVPHTDNKMNQETSPRGKEGTGGDGAKGGKGKTWKGGKTGKDRGGNGKMPPPEIPRHLGDDPKTVIGNHADTVQCCDRQGVTNGNAATDTYMAVGRRVVKFSDAIRMFPRKCIPSMMSTFNAPQTPDSLYVWIVSITIRA